MFHSTETQCIRNRPEYIFHYGNFHIQIYVFMTFSERDCMSLMFQIIPASIEAARALSKTSVERYLTWLWVGFYLFLPTEIAVNGIAVDNMRHLMAPDFEFYKQILRLLLNVDEGIVYKCTYVLQSYVTQDITYIHMNDYCVCFIYIFEYIFNSFVILIKFFVYLWVLFSFLHHSSTTYSFSCHLLYDCWLIFGIWYIKSHFQLYVLLLYRCVQIGACI